LNKKAVFIVVAVAIVLIGVIGALTPINEGGKPSLAAAIAPVDDAWRAALPHDPEAATQAYLARISPAARARSDAYFEGKYLFALWNLLITLGMMWFLLATGWSTAMRNWAERAMRVKAVQTALYTVAFVLLTTVISMPFSVYTDFYREHQYALATQAFWPWFGEQMIALAVSAVLTSIGLVAIYAVIRRATRSWWLWGALVGVALLVFSILISPVFIDPLFNKYQPLADSPVKQSILALARANGVPVTDVYEFDASRQTNRISANVSGFAGTTAIRLNDNLMKRCTPPEILAVMGHEMGHYVLNHINKSLVIFAVLIIVGFAFVSWSFDWTLRRWGAGWSVRDVGDVAGLPLALALFSLYVFVVTPVVTTTIRVNEIEADLFGVNATRQADGFAEVDLKLSEYRKVDPGPLEEFFFYDHPSPRNRIYAAMRWKAEQGKY
jgi:STE24 endopeptidase